MLGSKIPRRGHGEARPLIPRIHSEIGSYSDKQFRAIKRKIREEAGIPFKLKDFRPTLTTITINGDISRLPAMSGQLRHAKIETTQKFYASIEHGQANREQRDAWMENPICTKTPLLNLILTILDMRRSGPGEI